MEIVFEIQIFKMECIDVNVRLVILELDVFFLKDTAPTEIYTLSLHDALPICSSFTFSAWGRSWVPCSRSPAATRSTARSDRKSTRLNSSHDDISYAVFCL